MLTKIDDLTVEETTTRTVTRRFKLREYRQDVERLQELKAKTEADLITVKADLAAAKAKLAEVKALGVVEEPTAQTTPGPGPA